MSYQKGEHILPEELVEMVQKYIDGDVIYIPRKQENKKSWGEANGAKREIQHRNENIQLAYGRGISITALAEQYCLSRKSIERIVYQPKKRR
ncbi:hypothetical protein JCM19046_1451 [Bacillus sp. JCM 19046]|nr:hypothetical protein JCM19045_624 [Bacillus sp. JCM 19045]GAF16980.1 hypothetical protein JCM19046_1451 [Bacillus sp. JCM 19046]